MGTSCDEPLWDGTDGACPAYWRGEDRAVVVVTRLINEWLDRFEKGEEVPGTLGSHPLGVLRERLRLLVLAGKS